MAAVAAMALSDDSIGRKGIHLDVIMMYALCQMRQNGGEGRWGKGRKGMIWQGGVIDSINIMIM
jgi:hypothetical protein